MDAFNPSLLDALPDAVYLVDPDTSRIVGCNRAAHKDLLFERHEVLEHSVLSLQTRVHGMPAWAEIARVIREQSPYRFIGAHRRADGSELPVEVITSVVEHEGREHFVSIARDISRRPEQAACDEDRWDVLHDLADGVWDWYPEEGRLIFSPGLHSLLGYGPDEMPEVIETWKDNVHPEDLPVVLNTLQAHLEGERDRFEAIYRLRNRNGHYIWVHDRGTVVAWNDDGRPTRVTGMLHDETDARSIETRLQRMADHDALTELPNRRKGMQELEGMLEGARRDGEELSLIALDVDHFKSVNDRFGHLVGDEVLARVGRLIDHAVPEAAVALRWGGEEFLIGIVSDGDTPACKLAVAILEEMAARDWPRPLERETITASAGVARSDAGITSINQLIAAADRALYLAKRRGRNRVAASEHHPPCSDDHGIDEEESP